MNKNQRQSNDETTVTTDPMISDPELSRIPEVRSLLTKGDIDGLCTLYGSLDESLTGNETAKVIRIVITEMYEAIKAL